MRMLSIFGFSLSLWMVLISCSQSGTLNQSVPTGIVAKDSEAANGAAAPQPAPHMEAEEPIASVETQISPEALPPVVVAGGYLTCSPSAADFHCLSFDADGKANDPAFAYAFVISGDGTWTRSGFSHPSFSNWKIVAPKTDLTVAAIAMMDGEGRTVFGSVAGSEALNLVQDGSFESLSISAGGFSLLRADRQIHWKARGVATTNCDEAIVEYQRRGPNEPSAAQGIQWAELDSGCPADPGAAAGNHILYQDIALKAGHFYQLSYSFKHRFTTFAIPEFEAFQARFLGSALLHRATDTQNWTRITRSFRASKAGTFALEFEETGVSDRYGATIDDVVIVDLGVEPQQ